MRPFSSVVSRRSGPRNFALFAWNRIDNVGRVSIISQLLSSEISATIRSERNMASSPKVAEEDPYPSNALRHLDYEELISVLESHARWLDSDQHGPKPDLSCLDLSSVDLTHKDLRLANMHGSRIRRARFCDFSEAELQGADLQGADLTGARAPAVQLSGATLISARLRTVSLQGAAFSKANLSGADLTGSDLRDADLSDAVGVSPAMLARANLARAIFPQAIQTTEPLSVIAEASKGCARVFIALLVGNIYSWVTIATTSDDQLIMNSGTSPLPILGSSIPIAAFYLVAPIVLFALFLYLQLSLQRLWELFAVLPCIFPDGYPLDQKSYPWFLNGLICEYNPDLAERDRRFASLHRALALLLGWWLVPASIVLFWERYLSRHQMVGTIMHVALAILAVFAALAFHSAMKETLTGERLSSLRGRGLPLRTLSSLFFAIVVGIALSAFSFGVLRGVPREACAARDLPQWNYKRWAPARFAAFGLSPFANLRGFRVPNRSTGSLPAAYDSYVASLQGPQLNIRNLRYADLSYGSFVNGNFEWTDLEGANLTHTDLRGAYLEGANLQRSMLAHADLSGANLISANLTLASGTSINTCEFSIRQAPPWLLGGASGFMSEGGQINLSNSSLSNALLENTDLSHSDLSGLVWWWPILNWPLCPDLG